MSSPCGHLRNRDRNKGERKERGQRAGERSRWKKEPPAGMGKTVRYAHCFTQNRSTMTEVPTLKEKLLLERDHHIDGIISWVLRMMSFKKSCWVSI